MSDGTVDGVSVKAMTVEGRLIAVTGKVGTFEVDVWFAYRTVDGEEVTARTRSDESGRFTFPLPEQQLDRAWIGAELEGVSPVDLEPGGEALEPGDVVLTVDDIVESFLRYAWKFVGAVRVGMRIASAAESQRFFSLSA